MEWSRGYYRMKMMVVGRQAVGKSTLVAQLHSKEIGNEPTAGVDISEWSYAPAGNKKLSTSAFGILLVGKNTMPLINVFCLSILYSC